MALYVSPAAEQVKTVVTGGGFVRSAYVYNAHATLERYVFMFDGTSSAGTLIGGPYPVPPKKWIAIDFEETGLPGRGYGGGPSRTFVTGLHFASSSSDGTFAASGTADLRLNVVTGTP